MLLSTLYTCFEYSEEGPCGRNVKVFVAVTFCYDKAIKHDIRQMLLSIIRIIEKV